MYVPLALIYICLYDCSISSPNKTQGQWHVVSPNTEFLSHLYLISIIYSACINFQG